MTGKPSNMIELYAQARAIVGLHSCGVPLQVDAIVDLAVAYERERVAQQIRNRLRVMQGPGPLQREASGAAWELRSLLAYVESRDVTVSMGDGNG